MTAIIMTNMTSPITESEHSFEQIINILEGESDPERAEKMAAYMRKRFEFFGVPAPQRREATKQILAEVRKVEIIDWHLIERLWADTRRESHYLALDYLAAKSRCLSVDDIPALERLVRSNQWWDSIDPLSIIIGNIGLTDKRLADIMLEWSSDSDFWVRRVAIDHQLGRKSRTDETLLSTIICNNFGSREFFINKAIGWSLRDYSKTNPSWVRDFVKEHRDEMSRLSIREASKYL